MVIYRIARLQIAAGRSSSVVNPRIDIPPTPLAAVMSNDQWEQVYARVAELVLSHRTTLVFFGSSLKHR